MQLLNKYICSIFILLASFYSNGAGQNNEFSILPLENLPQNDVDCIYEDSKGFIWIGTLDGLHRFDGYSYKTYQVSDKEGSISSNMVLDIDEDSKGNIWIVTYGRGMSRLDPVSEKFINYTTSSPKPYRISSDDVTCITIDDRNTIWIGNMYSLSRIRLDESLEKIDEEIYIPINEFSDTEASTGIKQILKDKEGTIWVCGTSELYRIENPYKSRAEIIFHIYNVSADIICEREEGLFIGGNKLSTIQKQYNGSYQFRTIHNIPVSACLYRNQKIWVGNRSGVTRLEFLPQTGWQISKVINKENYSGKIQSNIVRSLIEDSYGNLWAGTRGGGVFTIDMNPGKFGYYRHSEESGSVSSNFITSIFEDHQRNLWVGTENDGINILPAGNSLDYSGGFQKISVNSNSTEDRAYCIEEILTPESSGSESIIWVGTAYPDKLVAIDPKTKSRKGVVGLNEISMVFALESQGDSVLWAGTYGNGLWRLSLDNEGLISDYHNITPDTEEGKALSSFIVRSIYLDRLDNLWIGTDKGLNLIRNTNIQKRNPEIEIYIKGKEADQLAHDYILQITESSDGTIWLGTMGAGLISCRTNTANELEFSSINRSDGLPNNSIKSILEDNQGFLWLASNQGLSRYNPKNGEIVNYDQEDGLQDNEFSEISAYKRLSGVLVFGGINGFNAFNPIHISKDTIPPKLYLTDFYILNTLITPGMEVDGKIVLEKSIEYTKKIELNYNQNSFSIGFLGLNYHAPQKNKYKYMLEGFDAQWFNAGADYRVAKYTNVPSGEYTFKVLGSNSDNVWTTDPASIQIVIRPHVLLSKLAFIVYFLIIIIISLLTYRYISLMSKRKKELLIYEIEKKNVEEIAQIKLRFFTNISHEFRTPLTLISTPVEKLIANGKNFTASERQKNYGLIKQNSDLLLRLVNQLLDFRRLDQGKTKMNISKNDLNNLLSTISQSFIPLAEQKNIDFEVQCGEEPLFLWFDKDKIEKVLYNILSNAFKFTNKDGKIKVSIKENLENKRVRIAISDTGIGIAKSEHEHIFERYYQPDRNNKQISGGTGIGLSLSKGLIELHKGEIKVKSAKGKGSTFKIYLNTGKSWIESESLEPAQEVKIIEKEYVETEVDTIFNNEIECTTEIPHKLSKILLVEDNIDLRNVVADIFRKDCIILEADDGVQGYEICISEQPDLVISDIMMPNMDGIELCHKIKNEEEVSHIPVLLLTAKNSEESQIEGFETGADAYIPKPFNAEVLRARALSLIMNREKLRLRFQKEIEINPMIIANSPADSKFLDQILALIEENLSESGFTVEKLADTYGVSRIYLNRKIKSLTGETANQFLRNIRLKHAAELLKQNVLTVSEITWHVGYNDLRTFRTRFKEKFGLSPSDYAKSFSATPPSAEQK